MMNKKMKSAKMMMLTVALMAMAMLASCSSEELCDVKHPHNTAVRFNYDWSNLTAYNMIVPDSMLILADRVVYQSVTSLGYDTKTESGKYINNLPTSLTKSKNKNIKDFPLHVGEYKFITVNLKSDNFNFKKLDAQISKGITTLNNIEVEYNAYSKSSSKLEKPAGSWVDNNEYKRLDGSGAGFILSRNEPLVIASSGISEYETNDSSVINFKPTTVTQSVNIFFDVQKDIHNISFVVDSVYAIISGIPHKVTLGTGALDISNTDKMIFKTNFVNPSKTPDSNSATVKDTPQNTKLRCYKNVNVLGIVENESVEADIYAGPGVMQVMMFVKVLGMTPDNTPVYRTLTGMVNIHKSLKNAKLQTYNTDMGYYQKTREHSNLYISAKIVLTKEQILGGSDGGVIKWKEVTIPKEFDIY